jgi:hypothetical protein
VTSTGLWIAAAASGLSMMMRLPSGIGVASGPAMGKALGEGVGVAVGSGMAVG